MTPEMAPPSSNFHIIPMGGNQISTEALRQFSNILLHQFRSLQITAPVVYVEWNPIEFLLLWYQIQEKDESDVEIVKLQPDASEKNDGDEEDENEVNTGEIIVNDVPGYLEVRTAEVVSSPNHPQALVVRQRGRKKELIYISRFG
ncbi:hypothetical protein TNCV_2470941 [Trichonephila clavipes]|nr:hypothetical protein TNCV_2470941 [Trichonephila clavipes]